jgi:hypothetical protein
MVSFNPGMAPSGGFSFWFAFAGDLAEGSAQEMSDFDSDSLPENEWEENGELAWNEFDWEIYLREQDGAIQRYLGIYESLEPSAERIDEVADRMGWDRPEAEEGEEPADPEKALFSEEIYTLQKNPVFVATKALFLGLRRMWEARAVRPDQVPQGVAIGFLSALHRCEEQSVMAIHALDFGDYAMAVCLFKRALSVLNECFALLGSRAADSSPSVLEAREEMRRRLFDLREIWLRVIADCREEPEKPAEDES